MIESKKEGVLRFFQQSAWVAVATAAGGACNAGVSWFAGWMGEENYGAYIAVLNAWTLMAFLSPGLQAAFSQLAVSAEAKGGLGGLWRPIGSAAASVFVLWAALAGCFLGFRGEAGRMLHISGSLELGIVLLVPLFSAFLAIFNGVLQGLQLWGLFGLVAIFSGFSRLAFAAVCFKVFGASATSALAAALLAFVSTGLMAALFAARRLGPVRRTPSPSFHLAPLARKTSFLTVGLFAGTALGALDILAANLYFKADSGLYGAAGVIGKVLVPLSGSLVVVMFPKVVRGKVLREKTDALVLTLGAMFLASVSATVFLSIFPELPFLLLQGPKYLAAAPLVPSYCWCVIPMSLAQVLLYNLLATERYTAVPFLFLTALGYAGALFHWHDSLKQIIEVMGWAGVCFLALTALFTWGWKERAS